ncbi:MAG: cell wall hydrolase, partial [Lachnospiraceae bacterium]
MRQNNKMAFVSLLLVGCMVLTTEFQSAASAESTTQPLDNSVTENTKDGFTSPFAEIMNSIPKVAAIAVTTQEWYGKAIANTDGEIDILAESVDGSTSIGKMYSNTIVNVEEKGSEWSKINSGGVNGFVRNNVLAFGEAAVERAKVVCPNMAKVNGSEVEVKMLPDLGSAAKGYASTEIAYPIIEATGDWVKIRDIDNSEAYVAKGLVTITRQTQDAKSVEQLAAEEAARVAAEQEAARVAAEQAAARAAAEAAAVAQSSVNSAMSASVDEQTLLAALIHCEAGGEPYEGQVAVGAVILNRVRSGQFPNSISEVIYQSGQFGPAITGLLDR